MYTPKYIKFLILFLLTSACTSEHLTQEQAESEIIALAKKRSQAVVNSDTTTLASILSSDFCYINIYGEVQSRKKYLGNNASLGSDSSKWISQEMDSITVQVQDNNAVITFRALDKFIYEGVKYQNYVRSTFVYKKQNEEWRCILGHTTKIGEKEE